MALFYYTCICLRLYKSFTVFGLTLFYIAKYFISTFTFFHIFTAPSYVLMCSIVNVFCMLPYQQAIYGTKTISRSKSRTCIWNQNQEHHPLIQLHLALLFPKYRQELLHRVALCNLPIFIIIIIIIRTLPIVRQGFSKIASVPFYMVKIVPSQELKPLRKLVSDYQESQS